jgi:alpha-D-ribose 1-methylphosphonate 5-phosphate C-P lyase
VAGAEVCFKHGVGGGGKALITAAYLGYTSVAKVILAHWQEDEEMVNAYTQLQFANTVAKRLPAVP